MAWTVPYQLAMVARPRKSRQPHRTQTPAEPRSPKVLVGPAPRLHRFAVSTGKAARYCFVTPGAILNWISSGQLPAQRTIGGQNRILVSDLRAFMVSHGMSTTSLDLDIGHQAPCWEYWQVRTRGALRPASTPCDDCPVFRSKALLCHEIRPHLPGGTLRAPACSTCDFAAQREPASKEHAP